MPFANSCACAFPAQEEVLLIAPKTQHLCNIFTAAAAGMSRQTG